MPEQSFPTVRYHHTEPPRVIDTAEDLAALDADWHVFPWTPEEQTHRQQAAAKDEDETPPPRASRR